MKANMGLWKNSDLGGVVLWVNMGSFRINTHLTSILVYLSETRILGIGLV